MNRDFKGIWIPREIWLHPTLSVQAKCLWAEIDSLYAEDKGGCHASDEYLSEFLGVKLSRYKEVLKELRDSGLVENVSFDGRRRIMRALNPQNIGEQLAGKPATSSPENRRSERRKTGISPYIENKEENKDKDMSEPAFGRITSFFFEKLKEINPKLKKPNLEKWATEIKRMMQQDERSEEDIQKVILYLLEQHKNPKSEFTWSQAVVSPEKLRKHFSTIWLEMNKKPSEKKLKENQEEQKLKTVRENHKWMQEIYKNCAEKLSHYPHIRISVSDNVTWIQNGRIDQHVGYAEPAFKEIIQKFLRTENLI